MATVALTTTPTQIDDGTSYTVLVTNTGAVEVDLSRGGRLRPQQSRTVYPEGAALTAAATSGTGTVTTSTTSKPLPNAADPAALAANAAFTSTYAPIARHGARARRPIPPLPANGTIVTTFQSGHGWIQTGTGTSTLNDTADYVLGSQSAAVTSNGTSGAVNLQKAAGTSASAAGRSVRVWVKCDHWEKVNLLELRAGDTTFTNSFTATIYDNPGTNSDNWSVKNGEWIVWTIPWSEFSTLGGTPNRAAITDWKFVLTDDHTGTPVTLHSNGIALVTDMSAKFPNGVVSVTFDDGFASQYTLGRAKLDQYGFPATAYVIVDQIGADASHMTLAQLQQVQQYSGWEVAAHAYTQANHDTRLTNLTAAQVQTEMSLTREWLIDNGFNGPNDFAYPGGYFNASVEAQTATYFQSARTISTKRREAWPPQNRLRMETKVYGTNSGPSTATVQAAVDAAYSGQGWLIMTFHDLNASPSSSLQYSSTNFNTIVDYLATKGIPVMTVGDVLAS